MDDIIEKLKNLSILEFIGALSIVFGFIKLLFELIPQFRNLKDSTLNYLARRYKNKRLERKAISSNIEKVVNNIVVDIRKELPIGWIHKIKIEWLSKGLPVKLEENQMILKLKPIDDQDYNLINGVFHCFYNSLFPDTKDIIPHNIHNSASLLLSKRAITSQHPFLKDKFETHIVEPSIKSDETVAEIYGKFEEIDTKGFFTGTFIREIYNISKLSRFNEKRNQIENEIREILEHIRHFQNKQPDSEEEIWYRKGKISSYGFILVAKPFHPDVKIYVNRAKKRLKKAVLRLYVLGCNQEQHFVKRVIMAISNIPEYKLTELYKLNRDYRGEKGGIGALFIVGTSNEDTDNEIEDFFSEKE